MKKLLLLLTPFILVGQMRAQYCLNLQGNYGTGGSTKAVITTDMNNDGLADLITCGSSNVHVLLGNGTGSYTTTVGYGVGSSALFLCAADFNKDGLKDIATANSGSSDVSVLLGMGTGNLAGATSFSVNSQPYSLCSADFNGDGNPDIATANYGSQDVSILLGNGLGGFTTATTQPFIGGDPYSICGGDFNGDGNTDLALACTSSNDVKVILGNGDGTFNSTTSYGVGNGPRSIISADMNNDGKIDLCTGNYTSSNISILTNNGNGTFGTANNFGATTGTQCITQTELSGDNTPDIASADYGVMTMPPYFMSIVINGASSSSFGLSGGAMNPTGICSGDFNGDGKKDIALVGDMSNSVWIYLNTLPVTQISGPNKVCQGSSIVLSASGADSYTWSANAGSATTTSVVVTPTVNTTYTLTGSSAGCGTNTQATVTVKVNPLPQSLTPLVDGPYPLCSGNNCQLRGITDANTVTWMPGSLTGTMVTVPLTAGNTAYTVTATIDSSGCYLTGIVNLSVGATPTVSAHSTATVVCSGNAITLTGGGASTYTWSGGASNGLAFIPVSTATYVVTGTANSCTNTASIVVTVNPSPTLNIGASPATICAGGTTTLSSSGAFTYVWSNNAGSATSNSVSVSPTSTDVYTVTGNNSNGCSASASATVTVNSKPTVNANSSATGIVCAGTPVTLTGSGTASTYTWTSGVTNGVSFPAIQQTYTVTGIDGNNCSNTATITVNARSPVTPNICMVTVDSLSLNNLIFWDKTLYQDADSFYVYRDTGNINYVQLAVIPYSSLSQYIDTARSISQVNGDPNATTYRYKISYKDTCGNMSPWSPYHNTIYQYNINGLFLWNAYQIEGQPTPVPGLSQYLLRRDNAGGTGNYVNAAAAGASSTSINDPQYATYQFTADWRVETVWNIACTPTLRYANNSAQGTIVKSKSNISNNRTTHVQKILDQLINVFPNPGNGNLVLHFNLNVTGNIGVKVFSSMGNEVYNSTLVNPSGDVSLDLASQENGIYLVQLTTNAGMITKRIIKN